VNDEHGRAVLELADAALDVVAHADDCREPAFRCGSTLVRIGTVDDHPAPAVFSHLPRAGADGTELVVHRRAGALPGAGDGPPVGFHRVRDEHVSVWVTDGPSALEALRGADRTAISWVDDLASEQPYARFRPFAEIFAAWFPTRGALLLHAAAVGDADGAVLLVGDAGSGKSTTAVLCSQAGLGFLADDFCVLEPGSPPKVHSIYRSAKLRDESARRLADVEVAPADSVDGDHYFLVDEAATVVSAPLRAIVAPRPATGVSRPRLEPVAPADAFPALLPTALKIASGGVPAYRQWLRTAHELARTVPAATLQLTWDTHRVVDLVRTARDFDPIGAC
jgi:hypothetical protein